MRFVYRNIPTLTLCYPFYWSLFGTACRLLKRIVKSLFTQKKNDIKYSVFFHAEFGMTPGLIARNEAANLRHASGSFSSAAGIKGCNDIVDKIIYLLIKRLGVRKNLSVLRKKKHKYLAFPKFHTTPRGIKLLNFSWHNIRCFLKLMLVLFKTQRLCLL